MRSIFLFVSVAAEIVAAVPKSAPAQTLAPVFPKCSAEFAGSSNGLFCRPFWGRIASDNGEVSRIDMHDLEPLVNGGIGAYVVVGDPRGGLNPSAFRHLFFDCRGHYGDFDDPSSTMDAPPRSVVGQMAKVACAHRPQPSVSSRSPGGEYF